MLWDSDLPRQRVHILARVHAVDGSVVHPLHGVSHGRDLLGDQVRTVDGVEVPGDQPLGTQPQDQLDR